MTHYLLIDDDSINNTICRLCIRKTLGEVPVTSFTNPREGFEYLASGKATADEFAETILFLDINMPEINGWEFLEMYVDLDEALRNKVRIYLLSSSINLMDIEKAKADDNVVDFISKPLSRDVLLKLSGN
jgi:CheY-like chemotaxis protein